MRVISKDLVRAETCLPVDSTCRLWTTIASKSRAFALTARGLRPEEPRFTLIVQHTRLASVAVGDSPNRLDWPVDSSIDHLSHPRSSSSQLRRLRDSASEASRVCCTIRPRAVRDPVLQVPGICLGSLRCLEICVWLHHLKSKRKF